VFGDAQPTEYSRWNLAERFGWSLEYVDGMSLDNLHEFLQVQTGKEAASSSILRKR
jgi:hypothetical protein